jgi:hypothetical protein
MLKAEILAVGTILSYLGYQYVQPLSAGYLG